jgi:uncharacterized membrane protein
MTNYTLQLRKNPGATAFVWWALLLVCIAYAGFALEMFSIELSVFLGAEVDIEAKTRQSPIAFMLHALLGGIALVAGVLQFNSQIRLRSIRVHRATGWVYVISIWGASTSGIFSAFYFGVPGTAKLIFITVGAWWFLSTSLAYWHIIKRRVDLHRHWMIRSYAISLFFITFPIWVPSMQALMSDEIAWPLGLLLAVSSNVLVAELWVRES